MDQGLYGEADLSLVPEVALNLSRGCGNPTGFANLQPGETVVDLGCGGGIDVVLAVRHVGSQGRVLGVDSAPQMIDRARQTLTEAGLQDCRVELQLADISNTGLPGNVADVVISNCVINLCPDKAAVYDEAFRLLKSGGRLAISDVVLTEPIDAGLRERFRTTWTGCLGGALPEDEYWEAVRQAGFTDVRVVARHILTSDELTAMACCPGEEFTPAPDKDDLARVAGKVASVKFGASKPRT